MKFGETFTEFLQREPDWFQDKCSSHVEYKRLKKVLKRCRTCQADPIPLSSQLPFAQERDQSQDIISVSSRTCSCPSCTLCDQNFFSELMKEVSEITCCFSSRVRHLLHLHVTNGIQKYTNRILHCFKNDHDSMLEESMMLVEYITMNAIAIRKILKKYDKVHSGESGKNFRLKMRAEHKELLQLPWLIELGAFAINRRDARRENKSLGYFSLDVRDLQLVMILAIPNSLQLEYDLTCPICLDMVFNPYALSCGHLFCKLCACSAASVYVFQGLKSASPKAKCPVCREEGVYSKSVHMLELDLLLKRRDGEYWKERLMCERAEMVKQSKEFWYSQAQLAVGL